MGEALGLTRAIRATGGNHFGTDNAAQPRWPDEVQCDGTETSLFGCPREGDIGIGVADCIRFDAAGVMCEGGASAAVALTVSETTLGMTEETGTGARYTVALQCAPSEDVTVTVAVPDGSGLSVAPASLTFTALNWSTAQTVTVTAAAGDDSEENRHYVVHTVNGNGATNATVPPAVQVVVSEPPTAVVEPPPPAHPSGNVGLNGLFA